MSANIGHLVHQLKVRRWVLERAQEITEVMATNAQQDFREDIYSVVDEEIRTSRMVRHFR